MKINEVPQDKKDFKDGGNAPKRVIYATADNGNYTQASSAGWEAENLALQQAWEDIELQLEEHKLKVQQGLLSPIAYFMIRHRMDIPILAAYVGKWQWQVKRHLKPAVFRELSEKILQKYATVFNISIDELKNPI